MLRSLPILHHLPSYLGRSIVPSGHYGTVVGLLKGGAAEIDDLDLAGDRDSRVPHRPSGNGGRGKIGNEVSDYGEEGENQGMSGEVPNHSCSLTHSMMLWLQNHLRSASWMRPRPPRSPVHEHVQTEHRHHCFQQLQQRRRRRRRLQQLLL